MAMARYVKVYGARKQSMDEWNSGKKPVLLGKLTFGKVGFVGV